MVQPLPSPKLTSSHGPPNHTPVRVWSQRIKMLQWKKKAAQRSSRKKTHREIHWLEAPGPLGGERLAMDSVCHTLSLILGVLILSLEIYSLLNPFLVVPVWGFPFLTRDAGIQVTGRAWQPIHVWWRSALWRHQEMMGQHSTYSSKNIVEKETQTITTNITDL